MRKLLIICAVAFVLPATSRAQQWELGLRMGYAPAMGNAYEYKSDGSNAKMSDVVKAMVPIQLDVGYRVTPEVTIGGYFSYGFAQLGSSVSDTCDAYGLDCSASDYRFGVQATYAFTKVAPTFVPWIGLNIGYEWASYSESGGGQKIEQSANGWEFLGLQLGADWKLGPQFSFGPYLTYSFGQYSDGETKLTGVINATQSFSSYANTSTHEWFGFGVRGRFDL